MPVPVLPRARALMLGPSLDPVHPQVPSILFARSLVLLGLLLALIPVSPDCWSSRFPAT